MLTAVKLSVFMLRMFSQSKRSHSSVRKNGTWPLSHWLTPTRRESEHVSFSLRELRIWPLRDTLEATAMSNDLRGLGTVPRATRPGGDTSPVSASATACGVSQSQSRKALYGNKFCEARAAVSCTLPSQRRTPSCHLSSAKTPKGPPLPAPVKTGVHGCHLPAPHHAPAHLPATEVCVWQAK